MGKKHSLGCFFVFAQNLTRCGKYVTLNLQWKGGHKMLQKYHALFSSYFETNGELKNCKEPETFVMGLIPLLECAEKDFKPHITYKKLHESCANGTFEIRYGLGRRTERLGVLNPSQYVKYIVSNVKAGRLVK
ncbi:MAG: hypothetical protein IJD82_09850, partial [Clostridia bacterium]|nr:hypothetical protein [Clostridia bacterium]